MTVATTGLLDASTSLLDVFGDAPVSGQRCKLCSHMRCRPSSLYVIQRLDLGHVKIGLSCDVQRRLDKHRKEKGTRIKLWFKRVGGCKFTIARQEAMAHNLLPRRSHLYGDWFDVTPGEAVEAVCHAVPVAWVSP